MNRFLTILGLVSFLANPAVTAAETPLDLKPVEKWLTFQKSVRSVEADFVQFRELKTLRNPLRSEGKVWIDYGKKRFRWQAGLGGKPRTIATKNDHTLIIQIPSKQEARRIELNDGTRRQDGPEAAFDFAAGKLPDTVPELQEAFDILEVKSESGTWRVRLRPRDAPLRKSVEEVVFVVDAGRHHLRGFELAFRDGSRVKTTFTRQQFNARFEDSLFNPDLSGYQVKK